MLCLSQNPFAVFSKGRPMKPSGDTIFHSSKKPSLRPQECRLSFYQKKKPLLRCQHSKDEVTVSTHHMKETVLPREKPALITNHQSQQGIGIVNFFQGKSIFVTGATGFLAKVLVAKVLSNIPDVGKIYLMINAENKEAATKRMKNEIINADIFKCLKQLHGTSYESFMLSKLIPVAGNLCEPGLGFDKTLEATMAEDVDIIINSAANTNFYERYDVAVDINMKGPQQVMAFAKKCKKLELFLQISTAYANGERQGRILENAFKMGESIKMENDQLDPKTLNVEDEIKLAASSAKIYGTAEMKKLGFQRAKMYGWQDSYVFTKAMGEMLLGTMQGDVPLVILRPTIIESTYKDPFPGWIEGNRMIDPVVTFYGRGQLFGFPSDPNVIIDLVPVDMVVNAALAAIANHGRSRKPEINVYHAASSVANPLLLKDFGTYLHRHFTRFPFFDAKGDPIDVKPFIHYNSMEDYLSNVERELMNKISSLTSIDDPTYVSKKGNMPRKLEMLRRKSMQQAKYIGNVYEPYGFYGGRFDDKNTHSLIEIMSEEERRDFQFDVRSIDWEDYLVNVHIPGLKRHALPKAMRFE